MKLKNNLSSTYSLVAFSRLSLYILIFGWGSFVLYVFLLVKPEDIPSFIKHFLSFELDGIKFRALILFSPLFFTIISFLMNERDKYIYELIALQDELEHKVDERIFAHKQAETALLESQKQLDEKTIYLNNILSSATNMSIAATDIDYRIMFYNSMAEDIFGYTAEEVIGKTVLEIHLKEKVDTARFEKAVQIVKDTGQYNYTVIQEREEGTRIVDSCVTGIKDDKGGIVGYVLMSQDVTERRQAEEKIKTSQENLIKAQEIAKLGSWVWDIENNILEWSDEIYRIFGLSPQEFDATYEAFINSVHPDDRALVTQSVDAAVNDNKPYNIDHRIILPDGTERVVHEQAEVLFDEDGNPVSMSGTVQDITERKIAEQKIQKSLNEKEILLAEIHHRVKNNMAVISSLLRLQSTKVFANEDERMFMDSISRIRSMALVHEKLYRATDFTDIDFSEYLDSLIDEIMSTYNVSKSYISISVDIDKGLFLSIEISVPLGLLINELLVNAIKHAFPADTKGTINVSLQHVDDETAKLVIKDNGIGMSERINIEASDSLGLQIVNSLAHQLDGEISFECDKGTEFCIVFSKAGYTNSI